MKLRPAVSCVYRSPSIFGAWLDFRMKELLHPIPLCIKYSTDLTKDLNNLNFAPEAKLFTADATSMYTNIDTSTGLQALRIFFGTQNELNPQLLPKRFLIITSKYIVIFGNTFWLQHQGKPPYFNYFQI
jgi:hypothetical protein